VTAASSPRPKDVEADFDLNALYAAIHKKREYAALATSIKRVRDAHSSRYDLNIALSKVHLAVSTCGKEYIGGVEHQDTEEGSIAGSLIAHAVILYASATESQNHKGSKDYGRGQMRVAEGWPEKLRKAHDSVLKLRNTALAHFGYAADHVDGPWATDTLYIREYANSSRQSMCKHIRVNYRQNTVEDLLDILPAAIDSASKIIGDRDAKMYANITSLLDTDADFASIFATTIRVPVDTPDRTILRPASKRQAEI